MDARSMLTRRDLLKGVTMVGTAVALPAGLVMPQGTRRAA
jgi:hypothetical protein